MSRETYDPRVQRPGGQFKGGSCDTMTPEQIRCDTGFVNGLPDYLFTLAPVYGSSLA